MLCDDITLFKVFSKIPLDIEGSNLDFVSWYPSENDINLMGKKQYNLAIEQAKELDSKVLFTNIKLLWDSCDCGDYYGCSHGSYVYDIQILNKNNPYSIDLEEKTIHFHNNDVEVVIPINCTIYDFIRACQLCDINLEFSENAKKLIQQELNK